MIGNEALANLIAESVIIEDVWCDVDEENSLIPDGFKYLSSGASRHAFLGPDGYVYKLTRKGCSEENESSYFNGMTLISLCESFAGSFRIAAFDLFTDSNVFVQEYIESDYGDKDCEEAYQARRIVYRHIAELGLFADIHERNVFVSNGMPVMIDW